MQVYKNKKTEQAKPKQQQKIPKRHHSIKDSLDTSDQKTNFWLGLIAVCVISFGVLALKSPAVPDTDSLSNEEKSKILNEYEAIESFHVERISNPKELKEAIKSMSLPPDKQKALEQEIQNNEIEMAWIQARDNMAEDGDILKFESQNYKVTARLKNEPVIFALPLVPGEQHVKVTGMYDGGGGITASVITSSGATSVPVINEGMSYTLPIK